MNHYILNDDHSVKSCDVHEWARFFEDATKRRVAHDTIGATKISTVFLGLDHRFGDAGEPLIFETMTFPDNETCERCSTWDEALEQHARVVALVKATGSAA